MYDLKHCLTQGTTVLSLFQLLNQQCMIWNEYEPCETYTLSSFSCWTSNVWFETSFRCVGGLSYHVSVAEPAMYDLKQCKRVRVTGDSSFSCWTSNVWFETNWGISTSAEVRFVSVAEPAMYDLKRHQPTWLVQSNWVSVAEPAMYDLKP